MLINDSERLKRYMQRWDIAAYFSTNVTSAMHLYRFRAGENIFNEGETLSHFYFLVEGQVKAYRTFYNGRVSVVELSKALDVLGEVELVGARNTTIAVQATCECYCLGFAMAECRDALLQDNKLVIFVARRLGERLRSISRHQAMNASYTAEESLALYITRTKHGDMFTERLTEAADYLGVSYRHLQRTIAKLCAEGVLERVKGGYRILRQDRLYELTKGMQEI